MKDNNGFAILLNLMKELVLRKRMIFFGTLVPTLVCVVVVMVCSSIYESDALINPPKSQNSSPLQALASASGMGDALGSLLGGAGEQGLDDCVSILESTRFASLVIKRFDLETLYKFKRKGKNKKYYYADVIKNFHKNAGYDVTDEKAIRISAQDKSAVRAKEMTEYMVVLLDSLYTDIQQSDIRHRLSYVDKRLAMTLHETSVLEDSMIRFQNRYNLLVPEAQIRLILENTTRTELRLETLKEGLALEAEMRGTSSAKYRDLLTEKRLLEQTLQSRLRSPADSNSLILPTHTLPALATEYFRLERAYMVRLGVYKYLVQQVEILKLDANKNVQVISVIDPPWVNDKRVSPKRRVMVEVIFIFSFLLSCLAAILSSVWETYKRKNPEMLSVVREIKTGLFKL